MSGKAKQGSRNFLEISLTLTHPYISKILYMKVKLRNVWLSVTAKNGSIKFSQKYTSRKAATVCLICDVLCEKGCSVYDNYSNTSLSFHKKLVYS